LISFKIMGLEKTVKELGKIQKSLDSSVVGAIAEKKAKKIADEARSRAPQGPTGNLKRAIKSFKGRNKGLALAVVDAKIAPHRHLVEFGTSKMSARPYWRPTLEANKEGIVKDLKDKVDKSI